MNIWIPAEVLHPTFAFNSAERLDNYFNAKYSTDYYGYKEIEDKLYVCFLWRLVEYYGFDTWAITDNMIVDEPESY
jgi:hypothetical protein